MFYNRKKFFDGVKANFATGLEQDQVDGFEILLGEGEKRNVNTEWIAYILATAWHETGFTMQPVRETFAKSDAQAIARLDNAFKTGRLGSVKTPYWRDGWFGRGYVQLTWKKNYENMGKWLGVDLVADPSKAMDPKVAAAITYEGMLRGMFTAKKLSDFLDGVDETDEKDFAEFKTARKIINGTDKAADIAKYAVKFEKALRASESVKVAPVPKPRPTPKPEPIDVPVEEEVEEEIEVGTPPHHEKPAVKSSTIWSALGAAGTAIVGILANLHPAVQVLIVLAVIGFAGWIIWQRMDVSKAKNISGLFK